MIRSASEFQVQTNCASPANRACLLMYNYETIISSKKNMFHKIILSMATHHQHQTHHYYYYFLRNFILTPLSLSTPIGFLIKI
jgi:hypothetical protein